MVMVFIGASVLRPPKWNEAAVRYNELQIFSGVVRTRGLVANWRGDVGDSPARPERADGVAGLPAGRARRRRRPDGGGSPLPAHPASGARLRAQAAARV